MPNPTWIDVWSFVLAIQTGLTQIHGELMPDLKKFLARIAQKFWPILTTDNASFSHRFLKEQPDLKLGSCPATFWTILTSIHPRFMPKSSPELWPIHLLRPASHAKSAISRDQFPVTLNNILLRVVMNFWLRIDAIVCYFDWTERDFVDGHWRGNFRNPYKLRQLSPPFLINWGPKFRLVRCFILSVHIVWFTPRYLQHKNATLWVLPGVWTIEATALFYRWRRNCVGSFSGRLLPHSCYCTMGYFTSLWLAPRPSHFTLDCLRSWYFCCGILPLLHIYYSLDWGSRRQCSRARQTLASPNSSDFGIHFHPVNFTGTISFLNIDCLSWWVQWFVGSFTSQVKTDFFNHGIGDCCISECPATSGRLCQSEVSFLRLARLWGWGSIQRLPPNTSILNMVTCYGGWLVVVYMLAGQCSHKEWCCSLVEACWGQFYLFSEHPYCKRTRWYLFSPYRIRVVCGFGLGNY